MVVALRYMFIALWYCLCILSCIDLHHFVYPSLSQTLYPLIVGLSMTLAYLLYCVCRKTIPAFGDIQVQATTLAVFVFFHDAVITEAEIYKQGYLVGTIMFMVSLTCIIRQGIIGQKHIENGIILIAAIHVCYLSAQSLGLASSGNSLFPLTGAHENPNITAMALALSIPFIIKKTAHAEHRKIMAVLLMAAVIFLTMLKCRTAYLGLASMAVCLVVSSPISVIRTDSVCRYRVFPALCIAVAVSGLMIVGYYWKKDSADARLFIWQRTVEMIVSSPSGYGYGRYEPQYNLYQSAYFATHKEEYSRSTTASASSSAYNDILEHGVQGGIAGGLLYGIFLIMPAWVAYRNRMTCCLCTLTAVCVMSMTNSICNAITPWIMFLATTALVGGSGRNTGYGKVLDCVLFTTVALLTTLLLCRSVRLAYSQKMLKEYQVAETVSVSRVCSLHPAIGTSEAYWRYLAERHELAGNSAAADSCFTEARKYTSAPLLLFKSAACKERLGDKVHAIRLMKTAVCMLPGNFSLKYHLMMMYVRMDDKKHATEVACEILSSPVKRENGTVYFIKEEAEKILDN